MFKQLLLTAGLLVATLSAHAETTEQPTPDNDNVQSGYIIDDLYIYMHAGAGKNFRIVGSINAGSPLELIDEQDGYAQVKDDKGRTGWVDQRLAVENQNLKDKITELENNLLQQSSQLPELQQQNVELNEKNAQLNKKLALAQQQNTQQAALVANNTEKEKKELLMYGAAIAFTGLLFGIIITLVLSRRKRYDGWA